MLLALILGTLLALAALGYVLYPVFFGTRVSLSARADVAADPVVVLREIEFDRATGKLSDADYDALRAQYTRAALSRMRAGTAAGDAAAGDAPAAPETLAVAEARIRRMRDRLSCATCGPRPEADATWCSHCGGYLPGRCERCGGAVREKGACFCSRCGERLAA